MVVIALLVVPIPVLFGLALLLMWLPLPAPFPPPWSSARDLFAAVAIGVLGMVYLVGVAIVTIRQVSRAARALDGVLAEMGLAPAGGTPVCRAYGGTVKGRAVHVSWMQGYAMRAGQLLVQVPAETGLVAAVGEHKPLRPSTDAVRVDVRTSDGWAPFALAQADQAGRLAVLLADPAIGSTLHRLLAASEFGGSRELRLAKDQLRFRARPSQETAAHLAREWIPIVVTLAAQVEYAERSR